MKMAVIDDIPWGTIDNNENTIIDTQGSTYYNKISCRVCGDKLMVVRKCRFCDEPFNWVRICCLVMYDCDHTHQLHKC
jgi:zinc ribbon protein